MAKEVRFLAGPRFDETANEVIRMSQKEFEKYEIDSKDFLGLVQKFINKHKVKQLPRLKELKRYYLGNNNIKYRPPKTDETAPDNRIASDFAKYITVYEQGYMLGKPVEYKNEDDTLLENIKQFSIQNNEEYHNVLIKNDLSIYGRAYELIYAYQDEKVNGSGF